MERSASLPRRARRGRGRRVGRGAGYSGRCSEAVGKPARPIRPKARAAFNALAPAAKPWENRCGQPSQRPAPASNALAPTAKPWENRRGQPSQRPAPAFNALAPAARSRGQTDAATAEPKGRARIQCVGPRRVAVGKPMQPAEPRARTCPQCVRFHRRGAPPAAFAGEVLPPAPLMVASGRALWESRLRLPRAQSRRGKGTAVYRTGIHAIPFTVFP